MRFLKFVITLFILTLAGPQLSFAYQPPAGIPEPMWGDFSPIDTKAPAHPSDWPSKSVTDFYYVDPSHPNATDTNNTYGYPDKPRKSFREGTYTAGSYVELHGGTYTGGGQIIITAQGTQAKPVWIRGSDDKKPTMRGQFIVKGSYIILENLNFDTDLKSFKLRPHNSSTLHHAAIRNCVLTGTGKSMGFGSVIQIHGAASFRTHDIVVYNNLIHDHGDNAATKENDYHGVHVSSHADNIWILDNTIYNLGGDSVQIGAASIADQYRASHIYIGNNLMHSNLENAVDIKEANHVVMSGNTAYNFKSAPSSAGEVVVIHNKADHVWVINNTIHSGVYGIISTASTNTYFIGNEIHDTSVGIHFRGASTGGIINNTIYNYNKGIHLVQGGAYTVTNNILTNRIASAGYDILVDDPNTASKSTIDNNIIHNAANNVRIDWNTPNAMDLQTFISTTGKCQSCDSGDPKLLDLATNKATITSNSKDIAINQGKLDPNYAKYQGIYGAPINKDIKGNKRLMGITYDIGAFELRAPSPPSIISIQ